MGLEQNNEQHYREVVDKYHDPFASYQMTTRDYVLRPTVVAAAIIITLPSVSEAKGRFYSIKARGDVSSALAVTIQDNDESEDWAGDITLYAVGQGCLLYSDGLSWMIRPFPVIITQVGPTTASNSMYITQILNVAWTGSQACLRLLATSSTTGAIGNIRPLMSLLNMEAQPSSQGHSAAGYFEAATVDAATNFTGVITLAKSGAAGGANSPFINFLDASTTKSTVLFELGTGNLMGTANAGNPGVALYETSCVISNVNEFTAALAIKVNGTRMYIPLIAADKIRD